MTDDKREAAKNATWLEIAGEEMGQHPNPLYSEGFDAGYAAARPEWVRIRSVDDLPKEAGLYLICVTHTDDGYPSEKVREAFFSIRKELWTTIDGGYGFDASAWMPLPDPFIPPFEEESE